MNNTKLLNQLIRKKPSLYLLKNYKIRGKPITFMNDKNPQAHRPWQIAIVDDPHPDKVVRKSRQLGLTEIGVAEMLWFTDVHRNVKAMFVFPRDRQVKDFVKTRMNPAIEDSEYFSSIIDKQFDSIEVKKIRGSFMLFRAPGKEGALGEGADIDYLSLDEYDRLPEGIEYIFQESMKSSRYGFLRRWSTPTLPSVGIDAQFQKSDQRFYMIKCQSCNHWQILNVEDNIMQIDPKGIDYASETIKPGTFEFVCAKCRKPLDRTYGEWVAKYPSRTAIRGYHISQLNAVWISADDIKKREMRYTSKQLFYNYVIGEPYVNEGMIITEHDLLGAVRFDAPKLHRNDYPFVVAGIDWGVTNWVVLCGLKENGETDILNMWYFQDDPFKPLEAVNRIARTLKPFNPELIIADEGFGADRNAALMTIFPGKVWACRYKTYKGQAQIKDSWNETQRLVTVDKTLKVQRLIHAIKAQKFGIWRPDEKFKIIYRHLYNTRIMDEEGEDGQVYPIARRLGDDHTASCLVYCMIGLEKKTQPFKKKAPKQKFYFDFW